MNSILLFDMLCFITYVESYNSLTITFYQMYSTVGLNGSSCYQPNVRSFQNNVCTRHVIWKLSSFSCPIFHLNSVFDRYAVNVFLGIINFRLKTFYTANDRGQRSPQGNVSNTTKILTMIYLYHLQHLPLLRGAKAPRHRLGNFSLCSMESNTNKQIQTRHKTTTIYLENPTTAELQPSHQPLPPHIIIPTATINSVVD